MRKTDEQKLVEGFYLILEGLGLSPEDSPHLAETPQRAARAWYHELCSGLTHKQPKITTFPSTVDEMVVLRDIPIHSLCAHHLLPFYGHAVIAYIPGKHQLLGLSKLSRIADYWARRPQVQEELTNQIADHLVKLVMAEPTSEAPVLSELPTVEAAREAAEERPQFIGGVGVIIRARHLCMEFRGVRHAGELVTSALRGVLRTQPETRAEFLRLAADT